MVGHKKDATLNCLIWESKLEKLLKVTDNGNWVGVYHEQFCMKSDILL